MKTPQIGPFAPYPPPLRGGIGDACRADLARDAAPCPPDPSERIVRLDEDAARAKPRPRDEDGSVCGQGTPS